MTNHQVVNCTLHTLEFPSHVTLDFMVLQRYNVWQQDHGVISHQGVTKVIKKIKLCHFHVLLYKIYYLTTIMTTIKFIECSWNLLKERCSALNLPNGGVIHHTSAVGGKYLVNTRATFFCGYGYSISDTFSRTCLASGNWNDTVPTCIGNQWLDYLNIFVSVASNQIDLAILCQITSDKCITVISMYRSGPVNLNTVNSKFHLIRSFFEIFARFLSFHV